MQTAIAQIVALITRGNSCLRGDPQINSDHFFPGNSTFGFCEHVRFVGLKATGGEWVEESYAADCWEGRWEVGDRDRSDRRIWRVTYGRIAADSPNYGGTVAGEDGVKSQLIGILERISAFARVRHLDNFAAIFNQESALVASSEPLRSVYHTDIAPASRVSTTSAQLLAAAQTAWVFGGMGSWNDLGFDGPDQVLYDELSEELYRFLNSAILAAANSSNVS